MLITKPSLQAYNGDYTLQHQRQYKRVVETLSEQEIDVEVILNKLEEFQVAVPSWALGTGGTRFGRFPAGGEPRNLEEKIYDIALLNHICRSCGSISLHIPWDIPADPKAIRSLAADLDIRFDAVNSNTFQDQPDQPYSYRYGSLSHINPDIRKQAVDHNLEVMQYGKELGSGILSVWLSDGSNFPGQHNMAKALHRTLESLSVIYKSMPENFRMLVEYKPFEPNFYSTVIPDWGTAFLLSSKLGDRAKVLIDLGHHLANTNIEQIVATVLAEEKLGGFHFNDSKYADDDLTTGSIRPYQLFLIFHELLSGLGEKKMPLHSLSWMIDASHNIKDPLEDLLQAIEAIQLALIQASTIDTGKLEESQMNNDPTLAQEILQHAFRTDLRPILAEHRLRKGGAISPLGFFRKNQVRNTLIKERGKLAMATGL